MRRVAVDAIEPFRAGGRGPVLESWLHDGDLLFPDTNEGFAAPPDGIVGAQVSDAWVVLQGVQVVQVVPEEVHSYWHRGLPSVGPEASNLWRIDDSEWLRTFNPRHLAECQHFVLEFYDELLEVVAEALVVGPGAFHLEEAIAQDGRLGYAYLRRAMSLKTERRFDEAEASFVEYLATDPPESAREYARRCLASLRERP